VTCELAGRSPDQYRTLVDEGVLFHNPDS